MVRNIKDVLRELGWNDGFNIPVASDENKRLEREVEEKLKKKASAIVSLESVNDRLSTLQKHLKNLRNEKETNQSLTCALRKQLESEKTMLKQAEFQIKKSNSEVVEMKKETHKIDDRTKHMRDEIKQYLVKVKELKDSLEWGEEALFAWEEEIAHSDRDYNLLQHFKVKDQEKFNELEHQRQVAKAEHDHMEQLVTRECARYNALARRVDATSKLYREVNRERKKLLNLWHDTVKTVCNRDQRIDRVQEEVDKIKSLARDKYQKMREMMKFQENHIQMNAEIVRENESLRATITQLDIQSTSLAKEIGSFQSEQSLAQKTLANIGSQLELQRSQNNELVLKIRAAKEKNDVIESGTVELQTQYETYNIDNMSVEQRCKNAEQVYKMAQEVQKQGFKELERMQNMLYKLTTELNSIEAEAKDVELNIKMEERVTTGLEEEIENYKETIIDQHHKTYKLELQLEMLNQEIMDLTEKVAEDEENEKIEEELTSVNKEIEEKQKKLVQHKNQFTALKKELSDKMFQLRQGDIELEKLTKNLQELKLVISTGKKSVTAVHEQYNNSLLKLNLLKMQAKNAMDSMSKKGDDVSLLERQKVHLETAMKERSLEINLEKDVLLAKKRVLLEEKANLKRSIEHINLRTKQFQSKYDITMDSLGKTDDGQQASVAYFKIKTAQEKYELQETGDNLEAKINKTEKEIQAMENTLRLLSSSNEYFRKNLDSVDPDDPQVAEYNQLELTYYNHMECLKMKKAELDSLEKSISKHSATIKDLQNDIDRLDCTWERKEKEVVALNKDIASKKEKLERATKAMKKVLREIKLSKDPPTFKRLAQREINVRIQSEKNKNVLQQLSEFCSNYMETGPVVSQYLSERGLSLFPNKPFNMVKDSLAMALSKKKAQEPPKSSRVQFKTPGTVTLSMDVLDDLQRSLGVSEETGTSQCELDDNPRECSSDS